jgi:hypothetical protein
MGVVHGKKEKVRRMERGRMEKERGEKGGRKG